MRREALTSKRSQTRRRRKTVIVSIVGVIAVIGLIALLVWVTRLEMLQIQTVQVAGAHQEFEEMIREEVSARVSEHTFFVFPRSNIYLFSTSALEEWVQNFAHVKDVSVSRDGFKKLVIDVTEREPVALWCSGVPPHVSLNAVGHCLFVDEDGYMFSEAPYFSDHMFFEVYGEPYMSDTEQDVAATTSEEIDTESGSEKVMFLGTNFLPAEDFKNALSFKMLFEEVSLPVHTMMFKGKDRVEYIMYDGVAIYTTLESDPIKTVNDVRTAVDTKLEENPGTSVQDLLYIDARFSDKIIFRFK